MSSQEGISEKFTEQKDDALRQKVNGMVEGSNHVVQGEAVPRWDNLIVEEDSHDSYLTHDWVFTQRIQ